jgi:hypothetical protein
MVVMEVPIGILSDKTFLKLDGLILLLFFFEISIFSFNPTPKFPMYFIQAGCHFSFIAHQEFEKATGSSGPPMPMEPGKEPISVQTQRPLISLAINIALSPSMY